MWLVVRMPNGLGKDIGNPPWSRSLPHVLVAIISSFLFGYHLGCVPMKLIILSDSSIIVYEKEIGNQFILFVFVCVLQSS